MNILSQNSEIFFHKIKFFSKILAFLFFVTAVNSFSSALASPHSQNKILCSAWNLSEVKKYVAHYNNDKTKHCVASCILGAKCGRDESSLVGIIKEVVDVFGPGNAEWADLEADWHGITKALNYANQKCRTSVWDFFQLQNKCLEKACESKCLQIYPLK